MAGSGRWVGPLPGAKGPAAAAFAMSGGPGAAVPVQALPAAGRPGLPGVGKLLARYGYGSTRAEDALSRLCQRLEEQGGFPHEIGLFLGYPLGDVEGFIQNQGQNCKCAGCWKVYCNELEAQKRFARIQKCRKVYARLWAQGRSVWQLTVAA